MQIYLPFHLLFWSSTSPLFLFIPSLCVPKRSPLIIAEKHLLTLLITIREFQNNTFWTKVRLKPSPLSSELLKAPWVHVCMLSCLTRVQLFVTPWTVACQAPLSMGFSRQEYWSKLPCLTLGDLPNLGIKPKSLTSPILAGGFFTISTTYCFQVSHSVVSDSLWPHGL